MKDLSNKNRYWLALVFVEVVLLIFVSLSVLQPSEHQLPYINSGLGVEIHLDSSAEYKLKMLSSELFSVWIDDEIYQSQMVDPFISVESNSSVKDTKILRDGSEEKSTVSNGIHYLLGQEIVKINSVNLIYSDGPYALLAIDSDSEKTVLVGYDTYTELLLIIASCALVAFLDTLLWLLSIVLFDNNVVDFP